MGITKAPVVREAAIDGNYYVRRNGIWTQDPGNAIFAGALAYLAADLTAQNIVSGLAIPFDTEAYDTGGFHEAVTNPSRMTVPSGISKVRLIGAVRLANLTADLWMFVQIQKNGSGVYPGGSIQGTEVGTTNPALTICSPILEVVPGDYFTMVVSCETDTSVDITQQRTWFSMQAVA